MKRVYENKYRRSLKEADAEEFVVLIAMKGPTGAYDQIGYADDETDIDYESGVYGYDSAIRENVSAMTRDVSTELAAEIIENAPAGDVIVGVVPYSTIPNEGGAAQDSSDLDEMNDEIEDAEGDEGMDDIDLESPDEGEEEEEETEEESVEESYKPFHRYGNRVNETARSRYNARRFYEGKEVDIEAYMDKLNKDAALMSRVGKKGVKKADVQKLIDAGLKSPSQKVINILKAFYDADNDESLDAIIKRSK